MKKLALFITILFFVLIFPIFSGCNENQSNQKYQIDCTLEGNILTGKEDFTFINKTENAFSFLKFNLYPNAFRKDAKYSAIDDSYKHSAYYKGESFGDISIKSVTENGKHIDFSITGEDKNILEVQLEEKLFPDEKVSLQIDFVVTLANVISRTGITQNEINLANFYPILCGIENGKFFECVYYSFGDPFFSECADYNVKLKVDSSYVVASSGKLLDKKTENGKTSYTFSQSKCRSFAFCLSKSFNVWVEKINDVEINFYYQNDEFLEEKKSAIIDAIKTFNNLFGSYPLSSYSVVETDFIQGGMEFSGLVFVSKQLEKEAFLEVIVHETAHQWWQTGVGNNEIASAYLDEGLCEYSVILFYEKNSQYGYTRREIIEDVNKRYRLFASIQNEIFGKIDTSMQRSINEYKSEYEYVSISYIKSCIMFDTLRESIGEKDFVLALKKYYEKYKYKVATIDDLIGVFESFIKDANGFFQGFLTGKVIL